MERLELSNQCPVTDWQALERLKHDSEAERLQSMSELYIRYREPILWFLRKNGYVDERGEDLLQGFFLYSIEKKLSQPIYLQSVI